VVALQHRIPVILERIAAFLDEPNGPKWVSRYASHLQGPLKATTAGRPLSVLLEQQQDAPFSQTLCSLFCQRTLWCTQ